MGEYSEYFKRFGHPTHEMIRVAINGSLPDFYFTRCIESFEAAWENLHPVVAVWFGSHFNEPGLTPLVLLRYMLDAKILISLTVSKATISYRPQTKSGYQNPLSLRDLFLMIS